MLTPQILRLKTVPDMPEEVVKVLQILLAALLVCVSAPLCPGDSNFDSVGYRSSSRGPASLD